MNKSEPNKDNILIRGARQNNLKNIDIDLPTNELIVVTGVSGSGKSTFAFDTIYAEGQRRYMETFSAYARQFLDRMDKPSVDRIEGIPPAIAIEQSNPVRTSRSTVGTMTELNDYIKLMFARLSDLYCHQCDQVVKCDTTQSIIEKLYQVFPHDHGCMVCFPVQVPENFTDEEVIRMLDQQGYTRIHTQVNNQLEVIQDRFLLNEKNRSRLFEAVEAAVHQGKGKLIICPLNNEKKPGKPLHFSIKHHCAACDITYTNASSSLFSFNSPVGACEACKGFGRLIGVDYGLVIPDETKTLAEGAIKPFQTASNHDIQKELLKQAKKSKIPTNTPWKKLTKKQQRWVIEGEGRWKDGIWFGIDGFFRWLGTKSYKMHVRVLLSKYRSYTPCTECHGARLKPEALWWRLTGKTLEGKASVNKQNQRLNIHEIMQLPLNQCLAFFDSMRIASAMDEPAKLLLSEVRSRLQYLLEVGLEYLTLDRQTRTLSGGEMQRINLTTALGTSLVNTLFVLDEPSIGLHARDVNRLIGVLHRLRDAGNSLLVVEHDPQIMLAADRVIDMGPGPGRFGGEIQFYGTPKALLRSRQSLTADYLTGKRKISDKRQTLSDKRQVEPELGPSNVGSRNVGPEKHNMLLLKGAAAHNLKQLDVEIPLQQLVCITGVSGSGKSTLMKEILYPALCKIKGKPVEQPGTYQRITGHKHIEDIILVDQSPIGKTTRSTPCTYVGAFEFIRKKFIRSPLAKERGYTAGVFSFNSGSGRCPTCNGNGFEQVEMQFLSDVFMRCSDCKGKRYRPEVLEVKLFSHSDTLESEMHNKVAVSIAEVLEMTVSEAIAFFNEESDVVTSLQPLVDVGLAYLKLGQSVPTLSGGEAQRLKLAGHLVEASRAQNKRNKSQLGVKGGARKGATSIRTESKKTESKGTLFLFDEPTTGLHFADIAVLMNAFQKLIQAGHSLLVIEHNLDVICGADWIIDIGPEGGLSGGEVVATGTPKQFCEEYTTHTALALQEHAQTITHTVSEIKIEPKRKKPRQNIQIHRAREHNLKNIDLSIPRNKFSVITGVSGSGKSTIAFDIVFSEGQRRYLESLNAYARQFINTSSRPDVDAVYGIPPTVAIEQRTSRGGRKSTAATLTEVYHYMRLLYVKLGQQHCPSCDILIAPQSIDMILANIFKAFKNKTIQVLAPLVISRKGIYKELAQWATKKGYQTLRVNGKYESTDPWLKLDRYKEQNIELPLGKIKIVPKLEPEILALMQQALAAGNGVLMVELDSEKKHARSLTRFSVKRACQACGEGFDELDPRLFSYNSKHGWCDTCYGTGEILKEFDENETGEEQYWISPDQLAEKQTCGTCQGQRLNPTALAVKFRDYSIADLATRSFESAYTWFKKLKFAEKEREIVKDLLPELLNRLAFMNKVGLGYLTLDRGAPTLSGGEAQRIRLASQLGSNLQGVCYILDEPSIGLHARDNAQLILTLRQLQQQGNTLLVVEHDEGTIKEADHLIDVGPGAGVNGGRIVAQGTLSSLIKNKQSVTGQMIAKPMRHSLPNLRDLVKRDVYPAADLVIDSATQNNLSNVSVSIPLRKMVCVSGVSGSGKSTLIRSVLQKNLKQVLSSKNKKKTKRYKWMGCDAIDGWDEIDRLLEVDQTPIGKTSRSCPATYVGIWDQIRKLFAGTVDARLRGYTPVRFSFNTGSGRCDGCGGLGLRKVEMSFLPDVRVACELCNGWRFNDETLMVRYKDKHVGEVLAMDIDTAATFFNAIPSVHNTLALLRDVGLGYLTLGQQSPTLSGGEAQRIKLVAELSKAQLGVATTIGKHTLYVLDEPTVGLHMRDVERLIAVLHRLVDAGNSVIVVEHNLDVIAESDWVIDMGPEGGARGGKVVAQGTPQHICKRKRSITGQYLSEII